MRYLLLSLLLVISSTGLRSQSSNAELQALHDTLSQLAASQQFIGAVAIRKGDKLVFNEVYPKPPAFVTPYFNTKTQFRIGSISKIFTATLIMQQIEEGQLSLSTRLSSFFPQFPAADTITINHLLTHSSGLHNFTNDLLYLSYIDSSMNRASMLAIMADPPLDFAPGSKHEYSNTNYVLLGYLLEEITGKPYAQLLEERIVQPLGLKRTAYGDAIEVYKNEAVSWVWQSDGWTAPGIPTTNMSIPHGAGGVVSTAAELTAFLRALWKEELISSASIQTMCTLEEGYGKGLFRFPYGSDKEAWGHNGGIDAFLNQASYFPEEEVAIAFTLNGSQLGLNQLALIILSYVFNE